MQLERRSGEAAELVFTLRLSKPFPQGGILTFHLKGYSSNNNSQIPRRIPMSASRLLPPSFPEDLETEKEGNPYGCASNTECSSLDYHGTGPMPLAQWDAGNRMLSLTCTQDIAANATVLKMMMMSICTETLVTQLVYERSGMHANRTV
jgi:hypothetical protein